MKYLLPILIAIMVAGCKKNIDLMAIAPHITRTTVYDMEGLNGQAINEFQMKEASKAEINTALLKGLLPQARHKDDWVLWKGSRLAVVELDDGRTLRLALSYYGGFFKVLDESGYYYFEGDARAQFEKAFVKEIVQDQFIPQRMKRNEEPQPAGGAYVSPGAGDPSAHP